MPIFRSLLFVVHSPLLLFVIQCSLFDVRHSLFDVRYSMFAIRYSVFVIWCSLFVIRYSTFVIQCSLFDFGCSLLVIRRSLFAVHCSLIDKITYLQHHTSAPTSSLCPMTYEGCPMKRRTSDRSREPLYCSREVRDGLVEESPLKSPLVCGWALSTMKNK